MSQILAHPWVQDPDVASKQEIMEEFHAYQYEIQQKHKFEAAQKNKDPNRLLKRVKEFNKNGDGRTVVRNYTTSTINDAAPEK